MHFLWSNGSYFSNLPRNIYLFPIIVPLLTTENNLGRVLSSLCYIEENFLHAAPTPLLGL